jgi:quinol monooxygenase YgiN
MSKSTVRVVSRVSAQKDRENELKSILSSIIKPTRSESGCRNYELLQDPRHPTEFIFIGEWENPNMLNAHLASGHLQKAMNEISPLLAEPPEIRRFHVVSRP